jgi:hypothetical protein
MRPPIGAPRLQYHQPSNSSYAIDGELTHPTPAPNKILAYPWKTPLRDLVISYEETSRKTLTEVPSPKQSYFRLLSMSFLSQAKGGEVERTRCDPSTSDSCYSPSHNQGVHTRSESAESSSEACPSVIILMNHMRDLGQTHRRKPVLLVD